MKEVTTLSWYRQSYLFGVILPRRNTAVAGQTVLRRYLAYGSFQDNNLFCCSFYLSEDLMYFCFSSNTGTVSNNLLWTREGILS